jgi:3-oxoacyl-[acyl-carrier protein] reductase
MNASPERRAAVLTGVGRKGQVGESVAAAFAAAGFALVIVHRDLAELSSRADELRALGAGGAGVHPFACDLSDVAAVSELAVQIDSVTPNGIDALVCLAGGFAMSGPVADSDPAVYHKLIAINLTTAYLTTRALLPALRRKQGAILYFSSAAVLPGSSGGRMSAYAAAKAGVAALMRAVAEEEAPHGVRANALAPTAIRTAANEQSMSPKTRYVEREQVAELALHLCSPAAHAITGQLLRLDA